MKIVFVRHGHPDYQSGHITAIGHAQAKAVAQHLVAYGIEKIYSSPITRAIETAEYTAKLLGLDVEIADCFAEIGWGSIDETPIEEKGHPWNTADRHSQSGRSLTDPDWTAKEPWCRNKVLDRIKRTVEGFDAFMEANGYRREGERYRVIGTDTEKTVAVFGHGGASTVILAHLMNIPFPLACRIFDLYFTNVTVAVFDDQKGVFCTPRFEQIGSRAHTFDITTENTFMR